MEDHLSPVSEISARALDRQIAKYDQRTGQAVFFG